MNCRFAPRKSSGPERFGAPSLCHPREVIKSRPGWRGPSRGAWRTAYASAQEFNDKLRPNAFWGGEGGISLDLRLIGRIRKCGGSTEVVT